VKGERGKTAMNEPGKSDKPVVPTKFSKMSYWDFHRWYVEGMKASGSSDRPRAGRGLAKENGEIVQDELPPVDGRKGDGRKGDIPNYGHFVINGRKGDIPNYGHFFIK